ncbi:MAG: hypothetical protein V1704_01710 [Candidatus Vogelbacteria bacterium]
MKSDFNPDRDWQILFGSFLVLVLAIFLTAVYLYWSLDTLEAVGRAKMLADSEIHLDRPALEQVVTALSEKKARFETLLTTPPTIVDPAR